MILLDTHVVVWLYCGLTEKLSKTARNLIENDDIVISPITLLEIEYLFEIKRITKNASEIYQDLHLRIGLTIEQTPWSKIINESIKISFTRDPIDRIIVGHAIVTEVKLLTYDENIRKHCKNAVWDAEEKRAQGFRFRITGNRTNFSWNLLQSCAN